MLVLMVTLTINQLEEGYLGMPVGGYLDLINWVEWYHSG